MSDIPFIQIYKDVFTDPSIVSLPPSYRIVLHTIFASVCFAPCKMDDHGKLIDLLPGQFMCTIRQLADISNVGKNDAERALKKFVDFKIVRQEVRHTKTIITVLWGMKIQSGETTSGTRKRQDRDIKEEDIEYIDKTPPPQTPQKKEGDAEDKKKINSLIKASKEKNLPFSEAGIYTAYKETNGFAVQQTLASYLKRNPKLPPLLLPDRWLRSAAIKEYEYEMQKKDYE